MINTDVQSKLDSYPDAARRCIEALRQVIFDVAVELEVGPVKESLKWHELSYSVSSGSPIRLNWKPEDPENCYVCFHCQTKLVATFRELYGHGLDFQNNRSIKVPIDTWVKDPRLVHCFMLAMTYHKVKHLPLLGA
ncbi:DUF1801 domain-containing protein [Vibrio sp. 10N.286.49.B1]|uniref:DUF1801 domain-containing protein n=1 Tax=unclassified Vibrio TaxID=2614977 RepID=UPI002691ED9A